MRRQTLALTVSLAVLFAAQVTTAETLTLMCRVQWSKISGGRHEGRRRLDIDLGAKTVQVSDDWGRGMMVKGEHPIASIGKDRIRLETGAGKESYVDRVSGAYYFHNDKDGVTVRGLCAKGRIERPRF
jgi:hypothetical protein